MYAFISNEYRTIINSQRQLDFLLSIYSYPKFKKVETTEEAQRWFNEQERVHIKSKTIRYGAKNKTSYVSVEYFIADDCIFYNIRTDNFGFIKLTKLPENVKQDARYDLIKLKVCDVSLDDSKISSNCIAIENVLRILGPYLNIELVVPDISIYLACVRYTGKSFVISRVKNIINSRYGKTYYKINCEG